MHSQGASAYSQTAKQTTDPRNLEANLLSRSAARLQLIRDDWDGQRSELLGVLTSNRRLWTIFLSTVTQDENPLPNPVKENVANLGLFVMNHTMDVMTRPDAQKLDVLININRQLAAGLRGTPEIAA
jgi:flagellar biosynthesis activator protein FlaF